MIGFAVLTAYKAGTYTPGMENDIQVDDKRMRRIYPVSACKLQSSAGN